MPQLRISALNPDLPVLESTVFKAAVTLIWPYSSSARQLALLLAEPDFRLRRKKGQVRARFSDSTAKALATAGVGIGDEIILSLRGAQFVQEGTISTPGKSIDWELSYSQTVQVRIFRDGTEIANLDLVDVAQTPAPPSPVRRDLIPVSARQWSSPAFHKRARLSDGPFFEAPYDPLLGEAEEGHDRKRQRKSYGDWKAWTYSARTPSPEKESAYIEDDFEVQESSPSRPAQLPDTPVSPGEQEAPSVGAQVLKRMNNDDKARERNQQLNDIVYDADYDELFADPDEIIPADTQYAFGGDTEEDTEEDTEADADEHPDEDSEEIIEEVDNQAEPDAISLSATEADTEDFEGNQLNQNAPEAKSPIDDQIVVRDFAHDITGALDSVEAFQEPDPEEAVTEANASSFDQPRTSTGAPFTPMPPPILPTLRTNFPIAIVSNFLTPIGRQPASPTLQPLDSSTLPLPSPFPGETSGDTITSFLDHVSTATQPENPASGAAEEQTLSSESYISETSFFSPINSSTPSVAHPNHETAFAPLRFTFGVEGVPSTDIENRVSESVENSIKPETADLAVSANNGYSEIVDEEIKADQVKDQVQGSMQAAEPFDLIEISSDAEPEAVLIEEGTGQGINNLRHLDQKEPTEVATYSIEASRYAEGSTSVEFGMLSEDIVDKHYNVEEARTDQIDITDTLRTSDTDLNQDMILEHIEIPHPTSFAELVNLDTTMEVSNITTLEEQALSNTQMEQSMAYDFDQLAQNQLLNTDGSISESVITDMNIDIGNSIAQDEAASLPGWDFSGVLEHGQTFNTESIADTLLSPIRQTDSIRANEETNESSVVASYDSDKFKDAHIVTGLLASPGRSTRSREKAAILPVQEEMQETRRTTRSHRSKASVTSFARSSISPPRTPIRSAFSPPHSASQASPYRLRSHSKPQSPVQTVSTTPRRRSRKHVSQASIGSSSDFGASEKDSGDFVRPGNEVSEGLHTSQAELVGVEETKSRSGNSKAVAQTTDILEEGARQRDTAPENTEHPSVAQPSNESSSKHLASKSSAEGSAPGSRNVRRTRRRVYGLSPEPPSVVEKPSEKMASRSEPEMQDPIDSGRLAQGQSAVPRDATDLEASTRGVSRAATGVLPSRAESSVWDSNHMITPEATQLSTREAQFGFHAEQHRQQLPMTPQLTQLSSAGLQSLPNDVENKELTIESPVKSTNVTKSTPRRNVTDTDVASASASPKSQASSTPEMERSEPPSIGLTTPQAYYTPLKDLTFFLNRSSQFHSASNPDLLALVTSSSTVPQRATKGPKHWNTTLHITDLSSWPSTISVNVFRAYRTALPRADAGDVILLRAFAVKSLNRHPSLISADESSWCVWRYGKPTWDNQKEDGSDDLSAREEMKGPDVEKGEGELQEVGKLRDWFVGKVKNELDQKEESQVKTRSRDKVQDGAESQEVNANEEKVDVEDVGVKTRSRKAKAKAGGNGKS